MKALKYWLFPGLTAVALVVLYGLSVFPRACTTAAPLLYSRPVLVIDAGHGGEDGGAISLSGASESQINLAIAKRVDQLLGLFGAPTMMLRQDDISLHDPQAKTLREKKVSDLHNRVNQIQQSGGILLSIHQNSFPVEKYSGAQVFYAPTNGSQALAEAMQSVLRTAVDPTNGRRAAAIANSVYLLHHISCPAVLVECGFLTNPKEDQLLQDSAYQTKLAAAMAGCWLQYSCEVSNRDEGVY